MTCQVSVLSSFHPTSAFLSARRRHHISWVTQQRTITMVQDSFADPPTGTTTLNSEWEDAFSTITTALHSGLDLHPGDVQRRDLVIILLRATKAYNAVNVWKGVDVVEPRWTDGALERMAVLPSMAVQRIKEPYVGALDCFVVCKSLEQYEIKHLHRLVKVIEAICPQLVIISLIVTKRRTAPTQLQVLATATLGIEPPTRHPREAPSSLARCIALCSRLASRSPATTSRLAAHAHPLASLCLQLSRRPSYCPTSALSAPACVPTSRIS